MVNGVADIFHKCILVAWYVFCMTNTIKLINFNGDGNDDDDDDACPICVSENLYICVYGWRVGRGLILMLLLFHIIIALY